MKRARMLLVALAAVSMLSCANQRAERKLDKAMDLASEGQIADAVKILKSIEKDYPDTRGGMRAAKLMPVYEGLVGATAKFPRRMALDSLRHVGRAVETYRVRHRRIPSSLSALVPRDLPYLPTDPWGRELIYTPRSDGYMLVTLGSDGVPGGVDDAADLGVDTGRITIDPRVKAPTGTSASEAG